MASTGSVRLGTLAFGPVEEGKGGRLRPRTRGDVRGRAEETLTRETLRRGVSHSSRSFDLHKQPPRKSQFRSFVGGRPFCPLKTLVVRLEMNSTEDAYSLSLKVNLLVTRPKRFSIMISGQ